MLKFTWRRWVRKINSIWHGGRTNGGKRQRPHRHKLQLEELESRLAPSTFFSDLSATNGGVETASGTNWLAGEFITDNSAYSNLTATLLMDEASAGTAQLDLYTDGGLEPGSLIRTFTAPASYSATLSNADFTLSGLSLTANTNYWIVLHAVSGSYDWGWTSDYSVMNDWASSPDAGSSWFDSDAYPLQYSVSGTLNSAPTVTTQPLNQPVNAGDTATFTAAASGSPMPTVQWELSTDAGATFNPINGATSTTLTVNSVTAGQDGYQYRAVFTNTLGSATSNAATLIVNAFDVTTQPADQTSNPGGTATFTAATNGNPTPTVQWQVSTNGGVNFSPISGATSSTLTLNNVTAAQNGNLYQAVFTNTSGTATTRAATLTVNSAPVVTTQPANQTIYSGGSTSFTVAATPGTPAITAVQWQVSSNAGTTWTDLTDGGIYSGVTTTTLTLSAATVAVNGNQYRAVFSNAAPLSATTSAATLIVVSPYAQAAYIYAYNAWIYAYTVLVTGQGSTLAYNYAYAAYQYATAALVNNVNGNQAVSQAYESYAYQYSNAAAYYSYQDYASSGGVDVFGYYSYACANLAGTYSIYAMRGF